jgi:hypothetical protein
MQQGFAVSTANPMRLPSKTETRVEHETRLRSFVSRATLCNHEGPRASASTRVLACSG